MNELSQHADLELLKESTTLLDYVAGTNPIYIGKSYPGATTSDPVWQIKKLTYDGNDNVTSVKYSGGSPNATDVWDNRATLTYT
jgi:hypothetical protein